MPVQLSNLPEKIEVEGCTLYRKSSFHISLVCIGKIIGKYKIEAPYFFEKIVADFCEFTKTNSVDLLRYRDEFKFASENERRAVIVMCDISNLNNFFDLINKKYSLQLEYPPTHATLYTLQPNVDIFLTDAGDIAKLTKLIINPGIVLL